MLGPRFCARGFSSCGKRGPLFIAVRGPLTIAASLVVEPVLQTRRLSSCGLRAQLLRGMWDLPTTGLEPLSPALAGRFSTTAPPRKPKHFHFEHDSNCAKSNDEICGKAERKGRLILDSVYSKILGSRIKHLVLDFSISVGYHDCITQDRVWARGAFLLNKLALLQLPQSRHVV